MTVEIARPRPPSAGFRRARLSGWAETVLALVEDAHKQIPARYPTQPSCLVFTVWRVISSMSEDVYPRPRFLGR